MNSDMLGMAERPVTAMETVSEKTKIIAGSVHDISYSMSNLVKEKRAYNEGGSPPSFETSYDNEVPTEGEYSEEADQRSSVQLADPDHGERHFDDTTFFNIHPCEIPSLLTSESNTTFTDGIRSEEPFADELQESCDQQTMSGNIQNNVRFPEGKKREELIEESSEDEVNHESSDGHNMCGGIQNNDRFWNEQKSEAQSVSGGPDDAYGKKIAIINTPEELTTSSLLKSVERASTYIRQIIPDIEAPSNSAVNTVHIALRNQEVQARTHQMERAKETSAVHSRVDSSSMPKKALKSRSHTQKHRGGASHKCNVCGKFFSQSSNLTAHNRTHTRERPFKCNLCGKAFTQKIVLKNHTRLHTGEKPYVCAVCGRAFTNQSSLQAHVKTHTRENF